MINSNGVLAVLDHHITINWDDGPTLHRIAAQVRYHTPESATSKTLRVNASHRYSDEPLSFMVIGDGLRASWVWQERSPGWTAQLAVTNDGEEDVYLDALDIVRIDYTFGGLFNLGAPPGLWRCAIEIKTGSEASGTSGTAPTEKAGEEVPGTSTIEAPGTLSDSTSLIVLEAVVWEAWSASTTTAKGFMRNCELLVQPTLSNRSRPPALLFRVLPPQSLGQMPTEFQLELTGEKFERMVGRYRADGMLIGEGVTFASPEVWVVSGDDAAELRGLEIED